MTELVTVVPGEAAESDSEEEIDTANTIASRVSAPKGVVVQGEASETESEEEEGGTATVTGTFQGQSPITPLKVDSLPSSPKHDQATEKIPVPPPKYDTLLHRKLRDRNIGLQDDICEAAGEAFHYAIRELNTTNQMLAKSQTVIQEVCHNLMVFSSDLKKIEEVADIINSTTNLPNFTIEN